MLFDQDGRGFNFPADTDLKGYLQGEGIYM